MKVLEQIYELAAKALEVKQQPCTVEISPTLYYELLAECKPLEPSNLMKSGGRQLLSLTTVAGRLVIKSDPKLHGKEIWLLNEMDERIRVPPGKSALKRLEEAAKTADKIQAQSFMNALREL